MKTNWQSPTRAAMSANTRSCCGRYLNSDCPHQNTDASARNPTLLAGHRGRRHLDGLVVDREIRQPNQPLGIVIGAIGRLHQIAAEKIVERRHAARIRMPPGRALHRRQSLCRQPSGDRVHADFRIDDGIECVLDDQLSPGVGRQRTLREAIAERGGLPGLAVDVARCVVAKNLKFLTFDLSEPAVDPHLPVRMKRKKAADDAKSNAFAGTRRRAQRSGAARPRHDPARERSIYRLQFSIVQALIGEQEGLAGTRTPRQDPKSASTRRNPRSAIRGAPDRPRGSPAISSSSA